MYTIVIPAYNEEKTIRSVLKTAIEAPGVGQVIVVDDGSKDRTAAKARNLSPLIDIITHPENRGKGAAIRSALGSVRFECVVFLDADLLNLAPEKITALAEPILAGTADFVKARFTRSRGRVTELAVKPMMQILFPGTYFEQPISGQFAAKLSFLNSIQIVENWGLDIGILLDAISHKQRIVEVDIGFLDHKAQSDRSLSKMSEQVMLTMIEKAGLLSHKYRAVLFSFDEAILKNYSMGQLMATIGKESEFAKLKQKNMIPLEYYQELAELFKDVPVSKVQAYARGLELRTYARDVIDHLRRRHYDVAVIGLHFLPVMREVAKILGVKMVEGIGLEVKEGKFTGELTRKSVHEWFSASLFQSYMGAVQRTATKVGATPQGTIAVASGLDSLPLLQLAGLGISYRSKEKATRDAADKTISILPELLVLVE